jgi:hypothetical protein
LTQHSLLTQAHPNIDHQSADPDPQRLVQGAQQVTASFADLQKLRENTTQAFLVETEGSISKRLLETRGYLEFTIDVAEEHISWRSEAHIPKTIIRLAEKALYVAKQWSKLQRKVKYWGGFLSFFSKPYQTLPPFEMASGNNIIYFIFLDSTKDYSFAGKSENEFISRAADTPDKLIHPYLIDFELCLNGVCNHFLSLAHFWPRKDSDSSTFRSRLRCVPLSLCRNEINICCSDLESKLPT